MPTSGDTKPLHVYEGLAAFVKTLKSAGDGPVWAIIEKNLTSDFIEKYNNWVNNDGIGKEYRKIDKNDW